MEESRNERFRQAKVALIVLAGVYSAALVASILAVLVLANSRAAFTTINILSIILTLISTVTTGILFVYFYRYSRKNLELNRAAKRRQKIAVVLLSFSAAARSIVNFMFEFDAIHLRRLNDSCVDESWHYSLFIFLFQLVANILPVVVFLRVFNLSRQEGSEVLKTLEENTADSMLI